jgi:hypothetical protein
VSDRTHKLILEIEVPTFWVDGTTQEAADEWYKGDILPIVTEEWMRPEVGITLVSIPGEKEMNGDFEVHAMDGRIVGARIVVAALAPKEDADDPNHGLADDFANDIIREMR